MRKVLLGLMVLSLCLILFALYKIEAGKQGIERNLHAWEQMHRDLPQNTDGNTDPTSSLPATTCTSTGFQPPRPCKTPSTTPTPTTLPRNSTQHTTYQPGDLIGTITIPKLHRQLPILEGTAPEQLAQGVGHYIGSVLPGVADNAVLAGHRDGV
ncbi:MAG TPA: sortase, partial [Bacilli bacterium]|nr:sortase [Bacilli bacterium]